MAEESENMHDQGSLESTSGRKKIRVRKRIKYRKKKKKFRPRKFLETLLWIAIIIIFIASFYLLLKQLDIGEDSGKKKKTSSLPVQPVAEASISYVPLT